MGVGQFFALITGQKKWAGTPSGDEKTHSNWVLKLRMQATLSNENMN